MVDDLRPDLGVYGDTAAKTPNIDALATSGATFERAYVSYALCAPSRASMLTGLRPDTTKVFNLNQKIDTTIPGAVSMPDLFRANGYQTVRLGKVYHLPDDDADGWTLSLASAPEEPRPGGQFGVSYGRAGSVRTTRLMDQVNLDTAKKQLKSLAGQPSPFFFAFGISRPHLPYYVPNENWDRFTPAAIRGPINPTGQQGAYSWSLVDWEMWDYADLRPSQPVIPDNTAAMLRWGYAASVSYVDDIVGELMAELKKQRLDSNTIVVLWGDHGFKLGDHGHWAKHSNADIDIHVPLIISAPGRITPGIRVKGIVESIDIYPTLAQLAYLPVPSNLEGLPMGPLFASPGRAWKEAAWAQYYRAGEWTAGAGDLTGYTLRSADFRYTAWMTRTWQIAGQELYDLRTDPQETRNVARLPEYAETVKAMEAMRKAGPNAIKSKVIG